MKHITKDEPKLNGAYRRLERPSERFEGLREVDR